MASNKRKFYLTILKGLENKNNYIKNNYIIVSATAKTIFTIKGEDLARLAFTNPKLEYFQLDEDEFILPKGYYPFESITTEFEDLDSAKLAIELELN